MNSNTNIIQQINPAALSITKAYHSKVRFYWSEHNTNRHHCSISQTVLKYNATSPAKGKTQNQLSIRVNLSKYGQAQLHCTAYFSLEQAQVVISFLPCSSQRWIEIYIYIFIWKVVFSKQHQNKKEEIDYLQNTFFSTKNPAFHPNYKGLDLTVTMPVFH